MADNDHPSPPPHKPIGVAFNPLGECMVICDDGAVYLLVKEYGGVRWCRFAPVPDTEADRALDRAHG